MNTYASRSVIQVLWKDTIKKKKHVLKLNRNIMSLELYYCKDWSKAGDPSAVIYVY